MRRPSRARSSSCPSATREPLAAELEAFLGVVRDGRPPGGRRRGRPLGRRPRRCPADGCARASRPSSWCRHESVVVARRSRRASLGGSIELPPQPCRHGTPRQVAPWTGEAGTAGTVAVVGAGKMGLPLAAQFAVARLVGDRRRHRSARSSRRSTRAGRTSARSPGSAELVATSACGTAVCGPRRTVPRRPRAGGRRRAHRPGDARRGPPPGSPLDGFARSMSIAPGIHAGSLVIFETTLPVGDTRERYAPRLEAASGLPSTGDATERINVAFSPERLYSGAALANLATYPKLVGGLGDASTALRRRVLRERARRGGRRDVVGRGGRVLEARRHDVPRREHRPRQRVRAVRRSDRGRHHRGHRRRQQPAVQPHPPAGDRRRRPLHPGLPALPARSGPRAVDRRAGTRGQRRTGRPRRRRGRARARRSVGAGRARARDRPIGRASRSSPIRGRSR